MGHHLHEEREERDEREKREERDEREEGEERRGSYLDILEYIRHLDPLLCPGHLARGGVLHVELLPLLLLHNSSFTLPILHYQYCTTSSALTSDTERAKASCVPYPAPPWEAW